MWLADGDDVVLFGNTVVEMPGGDANDKVELADASPTGELVGPSAAAFAMSIKHSELGDATTSGGLSLLKHFAFFAFFTVDSSMRCSSHARDLVLYSTPEHSRYRLHRA